MKKLKIISILTATCLGATAYATPNCTLDSSSTGWTGSISFHCDKDINLLEDPIYFEVSNGIVYQAWGSPGFSLVKQRNNVVEIKVKSNYLPCKPYILKANKQFTTSFSSSKLNYKISNFQIGKQARGMLQINLPAKPSFITSQTLPTIHILENNVEVMKIADTKWGETKVVTLDVAKEGTEFTIAIDAIDGAKGISSESTIKLEKNQKREINVQYQQQKVSKGTLRITPVVPESVTKEPAFKLINAEGEIVAHGFLNLHKTTDIKDLPSSENEDGYTGTTYKLLVDNFSEKGYEYTYKPVATINIAKFDTTNIDIEFTKRKLQTEIINLNVEGLPKNSEATLTIQSRTDASKKQEIILSSNKKDYTLEIPKDEDEYKVYVSESTGFYQADISPSDTLVANENSKSLKVFFNDISNFKTQITYYGGTYHNIPENVGTAPKSGISWIKGNNSITFFCPNGYGIPSNIDPKYGNANQYKAQSYLPGSYMFINSGNKMKFVDSPGSSKESSIVVNYANYYVDPTLQYVSVTCVPYSGLNQEFI